jgi:hypothetical protein
VLFLLRGIPSASGKKLKQPEREIEVEATRGRRNISLMLLGQY